MFYRKRGRTLPAPDPPAIPIVTAAVGMLMFVTCNALTMTTTGRNQTENPKENAEQEPKTLSRNEALRAILVEYTRVER